MTMPEVTDFISGSEFEDYDTITALLTKEKLSSAMVKAIKVVANRYLIISYGKSSFTHAILFDSQLKRFGKLKLPHVACIDLILGEETTDIAKNSIGFLQANGTIKVVDFDSSAEVADAVAILGKYQLMRARLLQLNSVEFENIEVGDTFAVKDFVSLDGRNTTSYTLTLAESSGFYRKYNTRLTGVNHSFFLTGSFRLNTIILNFTVSAKR